MPRVRLGPTIPVDLFWPQTTMLPKEMRRNNVKKHVGLIVAALSLGIVASVTPTSHAQNQTGISKLQAISLQLI